MKIHEVHERILAGSREQVGALLEDVDRVWPKPPPQRDGNLFTLDPIAFELLEHRPNERLTFRVVSPVGFNADHWLELEPTADGRTILRHVLDGEVTGAAEALWRGGLEQGHYAYTEALLARAQEVLT